MRDNRRCTARTSGSKQRCRRPAISGGFVCRSHGGASPQVKRKARERLADLIDPDRVLRNAAEIAYSDLRDLFDDKARLLPPDKWPERVARAVQSIEVTKRNLTAGDGEQEQVVKIRMWDKPKVLEFLFKYNNLFEAHKLAGAEKNVLIVDRLQAGRKRVSERDKSTR